MWMLSWDQDGEVEDDADEGEGHLHEDEPCAERGWIAIEEVGIDEGEEVVAVLAQVDLVRRPVDRVNLDLDCVHWKKT